MLRILGSSKRLCSGTTRRDLLQIGSLGLAGLSLDQLLAGNAARTVQGSSAAERHAGFGQAKQCILLYLYGAPSQLETFDMKPNAPVEIRGSMQPIPSVLPGLDVCEHLPEISKMTDKITVVRSISHPYPVHGVAFATTGIPAIDVAMELAPADPRHYPFFGSVVQYCDQRASRSRTDLPQNVALPFQFSSQRTGEVFRAGPYGAFLGAGYNPTWTEYHGKSTRSVVKTLGANTIDCHDPYLGCDADSHFRLSSTGSLPDMTIDRLSRRKSLLSQFDDERRSIEAVARTKTLSKYQDLAFHLLSSSRVAEALDVRRESQALRDRYGMTLFGQSCLAARRMIEAGTRLVSVFWDEYGLAGDAWDTHWNHFPRMTDQLLPGFDKAFAGLVTDLDERGLLDETLVVVLSDHGRTPKINAAKGGGRDHWSQVYSLAFAGGGLARGKVVGASDATAATPTDRPVSPKDILATMYHLLGIDPHSTIPDRDGRQLTIVPDTADVVSEMLA